MSDDGGPAYPYAAWEYTGSGGETALAHHAGAVTLRDYFAAAALNGAMGASKWTAWGHVASSDAEQWAEQAYIFADAMLAERAK